MTPAAQYLDNLTQPVTNSFRANLRAWSDAHNRDLDDSAKIAQESRPPDTPPGLTDPSYRSLVEDFEENQWLFGTFAFVPHTMLVLLLALFMGILGSLIQLAKELVNGVAGQSIGEMSFRIGLGAAVALALFCFAAAGVLALSTAGQSKTNMSPYLISFLGITAGYLSDRVTDWMREVGEQTFKLAYPKQPDRGAIGVDAEMKRQGITAAVAGPIIGETAADITDWSGLNKAVPDSAQKSLAHYLRVNPSQLFTDVDPH